VAVSDFVPDHSGGTTPDFHGIPSYAPPGTLQRYFLIQLTPIVKIHFGHDRTGEKSRRNLCMDSHFVV
jgi:hypothetical protein